MAKDFMKKLTERKEANPPRYPIPQIDPEASKPTPAASVEPTHQPAQTVDLESPKLAPVSGPEELTQGPSSEPPVRLTIVDPSEKPQSLSSQILPSRHAQLRDLAYMERRGHWEILEDAFEEYVVKHYGKQYKRRTMDK